MAGWPGADGARTTTTHAAPGALVMEAAPESTARPPCRPGTLRPALLGRGAGQPAQPRPTGPSAPCVLALRPVGRQPRGRLRRGRLGGRRLRARAAAPRR